MKKKKFNVGITVIYIVLILWRSEERRVGKEC